MAKKRKTSSRPEQSKGPNLDVGESRKRIRDFEDVADSDDEFHINRDKILLDEEPETKRRRKWQEQEEFLQPSDEEVLDYSDEGDEDVDEEVMGGQHDRYDQDALDAASEESDEGDAAVDDEEGIGWGMSKEELYGADEIETEEQALEEEKEALRLQKKQLQAMTAADYGFDEADWQQDVESKAEIEDRDTVTEVLPQLQVSDGMDSAERLKLLKQRYPEFEPLSEELLRLMDLHPKLVDGSLQMGLENAKRARPNATTKLRAASAYMGALTMYFGLLTSPASSEDIGATALPPAKMREHRVMDTLVKCRELWSRAQRLPADPKPANAGPTNARDLADRPSNHIALIEPDVVQRQPAKKSRAQRHAEAARAEAEVRRAQRLQKTEAGLADLDALIAPSATNKSSKPRPGLDEKGTGSDVGEEAPMTAKEAAEKAKHKKSLRFYTSQIAQKANKRGTAGKAAGGDEDIPYRERLKDRQARLNAEAEKKGRRTIDAGAELGGESDEEDARQAQEIRAGGEDDDYYDLVAARTAKKKSEKAALTEARKQAALQGGQVIQEATVGSDGKRKITYAIEKNKGLTPHRRKENRNPRVKKRKKFDEKKKKLGSIKPVYKGGEGRGGYGGELTGIKKGLVKSTKL